jgi:hypothetical protein
MPLNDYYFTFGQGQENEGCFTIIEAENELLARRKMFELYGNKWASVYTETSWFIGGRSQQDIYGYEEI